MAYSFTQDIKSIRDLHKSGGGILGKIGELVRLSLGDDASQSNVAQNVDTRTESFRFLIRKTIPIMYCIVWEAFRNELELQDKARYQKHFTHYSKWYNEPINEIALIRHCIIHNNGKIDQEYLTRSKLKTFNTIGDSIDFDDKALDIQFQIFEDAYVKIMT